MKKTKRPLWNRVTLTTLGVMALSSGRIHAGSDLSFDGNVWGNYSYDFTKNANHSAGFDITRAYFGLKYKLDDIWSGRLLLDHDRTKVGNSSIDSTQFVYVRNAYIQGELWGDDGVLRIGLQPTPFIAGIDEKTQSRWLAKSAADESGVLLSTEGGVGASGSAGAMLKYSVLVHNGAEGLSRGGSNKDGGIAGTAMLSVSPFASSSELLRGMGATVNYTMIESGPINSATYASTGRIDVIASALHWNTTWFSLVAEYLNKKPKSQKTQQLWGGTATLKLIGDFAAFGRYLSGNDDFKRVWNKNNIWTAGATYNIVKDKLNTALLWEQYQPRSGYTVKGIYWKWAAKF